MRRGKIKIENGAMPDRYELEIARVFIEDGFELRFLKPVNQDKVKTPDVVIGGVAWEMKTLRTKKMSGVEQALKRASKQSSYVIISMLYNKYLDEADVEKFLGKKLKEQKSIKRIIIIKRSRGGRKRWKEII
ncbi:hypothetical protein IKF15_02515 [Candidatus Saccharibacteria bacterium]|nr:hypothetical protein [Candidatus Saccharibacteria bacterium]